MEQNKKIYHKLKEEGWQFSEDDDGRDCCYYFKSPRMKEFSLYCFRSCSDHMENVFTEDVLNSEIRYLARKVYEKNKYTIEYQILKQLYENLDRKDLKIDLNIEKDWKYLI